MTSFCAARPPHSPPKQPPCPLCLRAHSWVSPSTRHLLVKPRSQNITFITIQDNNMLSAHSLHCQAAAGHTLESVTDDLNIHPTVSNIQNCLLWEFKHMPIPFPRLCVVYVVFLLHGQFNYCILLMINKDIKFV